MAAMHGAAWTDLDRLVDDAMACWGVPGVAVGVVEGDDIILLRGYGVRDVGNNAPVTTATQFMICSLTKSITAAGLALLVDERRLRWDTKVRAILPEFELRDAAASAEATVADLLTHRTGLPAHDRIWSPPGERSRQQMLEAMRYLEPSRRFRECHQYSNLGYVVAGMLAERLSGKSWEAFTTQRLLSPLGFSSFGFSKAALESAPDHAHPHEWDMRSVLRGKLWPMQATPAGGINASVADMALWLRLLLSRGRVDGRQLLTPASMDAMMTPHIDVGESEFAEIGKIQYGFGLRCAHYRGNATISHTGSQPGWGAFMTMMPERRIGVIVLTNGDFSPVCALIAYATYDRLLALGSLDWFTVFRTKHLALLQEQEAQERGRIARYPADPRDDGLTPNIEGIYRHPAYGCISIVQKAAGMHWEWRGLEGLLVHHGRHSYQLKERGVPRYPAGLFVSLEMNAEGQVVALKSPLEPVVSDIVFQRDLNGENP